MAFDVGDEAVRAWGVVISTDTAFLIGVLALLRRACPPQLRVFLLALAIADDVGALSGTAPRSWIRLDSKSVRSRAETLGT